jgi:hypothetical protein
MRCGRTVTRPLSSGALLDVGRLDVGRVVFR